jgi:hypothetical protein
VRHARDDETMKLGTFCCKKILIRMKRGRELPDIKVASTEFAIKTLAK